ncbi:MAG: tRNA threonylcarbamoyladenosine dehydratase [Bacteroidales bacterium]|nr:tRNA threonylcarbamoyladenosine dehydratase [Bacteroidales bacterium]
MAGKEIFARTELLLGPEAMEKLAAARVLVFGVGGVGSWCAEGLIRTGVGHLTIVDSDHVCASNINRQLMATTATVGLSKVEVLRSRLLEINPEAHVTALHMPFNEDTAGEFDLDAFDVVIDAIDTLKNKILLILKAASSRAEFFSSMGAALKVDPTQIRVTDFWDVREDPLARMLRKRIRQGKVLPEKPFKVVWSPELLENKGTTETRTNGTAVAVTAAFGFTLASLATRYLCSIQSS